MTTMEQGLRYIEREIRFMVKDPFGNATYAKFADRVVEDACGIPNFCSTVLSSKRPMTAILRVIRGSHGSIIMKFFNASLHDARIEMVRVLAEATKLRLNGNKSSKEAHVYLMKLYRKAIKRTIKLVTDSKNKASYKNMYRSLRSYAQMDSYDSDDDDDEDEDDAYFDNLGEFGDSDYAEASLDAYRNGTTPPVIPLDRRGPIASNLMGNDEIMREIAAIEAKMGRPMTDAELDRFICGDDDDDEIGAESMNARSDKMMDEIVDLIYEKLAARLGVKSPASETLDDFIERQEQEEAAKAPIAEEADKVEYLVDGVMARSVSVPENPSLENLVEIHNQMNASVEVGGSKAETADESDDDDDSSHLPPVDSTGGNESGTDEKKLEKIMTINDIIRDFDIFVDSEIQKMARSMNINLDLAGLEVADIYSTLIPAREHDLLFKLCSTVRVSGDYETVNDVHLQMIMSSCVKRIAERLEIGEDYIGTELSIVDSSEAFSVDIFRLNHSKGYDKKYSSSNTYALNLRMCALAYYMHKEFGKNMIDVRYINDPNSDSVLIYFYPKSSSVLEGVFRKFFAENVVAWNILDEICTNADQAMFHVGPCMIDFDNPAVFTEALKKNVPMSLATPYCEKNIDYIKYCIGELGKDVKGCNVYTTNEISTTPTSVSVDLIYRIETGIELTSEEKREIERQLSINGDCQVQLRDALRSISNNIIVEPYYMYSVIENDEEEAEPEVPETPSKTGFFGL